MAALTGDRLAAKEQQAAILAAATPVIAGSYTLASLPPANTLDNLKTYYVSDYGGFTAKVVNGRWEFGRLKLAWAALPSATLVPNGTEASVTDVGGAIAVAGVAGWVFRPIVITFSNKVTITGSTVEQELASYTIPGSLVGKNGTVYMDSDYTFTGSTNAKTMYAKLNGQDLYGGYKVTNAGAVAARRQAKSRFRDGVKQTFPPLWGYDGSTSILTSATIDWTQPMVAKFTAKLDLATESLAFEGGQIIIQPAM